MTAQTQSGILLSALCPKFLHTNSTSHTWPFSAVAELIDNAYDPDVNAKQIWIDKTVINENICLTFTDNGNGMTSEKLHKMLSFGFSDKVSMNGRVPIGLYGNGFKSGSMRIGKDAIIFTKNGETMSVGLLSQTYLESTKAEHVVVPIVAFNKDRQLFNLTESKASLRAILEHSLFSTEQKLLAELDAIMGKKGTRIIIWNLRRDNSGRTEFEFDKDKYDIRIPEDLDETGKKGYKKQERMDQVVPESDYSLRANNMGVGVVGIIECNFLKPTHNKQDFDYTNEYRLTIAALGEKLNDYWNEMKVKKNAEYPLNLPVEDIQKRPDQTWVQCDSCLKWRKLPDGIDHLPEKWYCSLNPDPQFRSCIVPEEPEDDDLVHPTYEKTYKKKDKEKFKMKRLECNPQPCNELLYVKSHPVPSIKDFATPVKESVPRSHLSSQADLDNSLKRRSSGGLTLPNAKVTKYEDDEDVIILEENSTPKPSVDADVTIVKTEQIHTEQSDTQSENDVDKEPCEGNSSLSNSICDSEQKSAATQTEVPNLAVKKEEAVEEDMDGQHSAQQAILEAEAKSYALNTSDQAAGDIGYQLSELRNELQLVNEEKENYKRQCEMLMEKVKKLEMKIVEMNDRYVKKETCHQSTETDATVLLGNVNGNSESPDQMAFQFEQTLKEIEKLTEHCNTLQNLKAECSKCSSSGNKTEVDEMAVQLDDVFRQLDKCSVERDQYKNEVELLEMEKTQMGFQCEELKTEVEQLKATISQMTRSDDSTTSNIEASMNYSDRESLKLRSLRVNVGQLLASIMPDLDLQQVNYDIDVVDEILGQVVEQMHEISST
ncbi:MORC family CW-type zinc finger protein 3 isoform X3 [Petaurus breviceps papuanus]|uniref:MORC family CW-type zinc finger protein 3 isoform X3 n=1 Tax=Petaurus breviceps papuanus TaxID=3040969 RepID=UPI0036DC8B22